MEKKCTRKVHHSAQTDNGPSVGKEGTTDLKKWEGLTRKIRRTEPKKWEGPI